MSKICPNPSVIKTSFIKHHQGSTGLSTMLQYNQQPILSCFSSPDISTSVSHDFLWCPWIRLHMMISHSVSGGWTPHYVVKWLNMWLAVCWNTWWNRRLDFVMLSGVYFSFFSLNGAVIGAFLVLPSCSWSSEATSALKSRLIFLIMAHNLSFCVFCLFSNCL